MAGIDIDMSRKIISKTDTQGRILSANDYFYDICGYTEKECLNQPHNMIRHPDMPKLVFRLLWVKLRHGMKVNAFVKNSTKSGNHYWVFATVSPTFKNGTNDITAYYSIRKKANSEAVEVLAAIYDELNAIERSEGKEASKQHLKTILDRYGMKFNDLMLRIQSQGKLALI